MNDTDYIYKTNDGRYWILLNDLDRTNANLRKCCSVAGYGHGSMKFDLSIHAFVQNFARLTQEEYLAETV